VDSLEGRQAIQKDLDRLESWAITSCMKFNKSECQIVDLGRGNPGLYVQTEGRETEEQPHRKRSGGLG